MSPDPGTGAPHPLRILIVTPTIPYPPNWGFGIRVYQFVRELSRRHEVSVLCYAREGEEDKVAALESICHAVHTVPNPHATERSKRRAQMSSLVRRRSFQASSIHTDAMVRAIGELQSGDPFDLVQFESSQTSSLPILGDTPWILDEHNLEYELLQRMFQTERSPLRKLYNWREYRKFRREEMASWRDANACVVTSERERAIVAEHEVDQLVHVAPNGVDIDYFSPDDGSEVDIDDIVFTGLMSYRPNIDAVCFFVNSVLPMIVAEKPNMRFTIVGQGAPAEVTRLEGPNVRVVGKVPDVRPFVRRAAVFVVPLRMGSGTRLKILEGLAMGKGMVSTTLGCEGIDVLHGEHLVVADVPEDFARAVVALIDDTELASRLASNGRSLVESKYSWVSIVSDLEAFHAKVLGAARRRIDSAG